MDVLDRVPHDIYHLPAYHRLTGFGQKGTPQAFAYQEGERAFLWPYLLTPIDGAPGCHDATSVYGYPGPAATPSPEFLTRAWHALLEHWRGQHVVSAFTRFHPLLENHRLLEHIPEAREGLREFGNTVCIDLTLPADTQFQQYHKNLRYDIRKAREAGLVTRIDDSWSCKADFVAVYRDTMARCGSRPEYVVDEAWVDEFRNTLGRRAKLFVTWKGDTVAAAMIVLVHHSILQCHLTGSAPDLVAFSPSKLLLDDVRRWGLENGYKSMHLGGGLGGREDALYQFKRKFSPLTHPFHTGSWILDPALYRELDVRNRANYSARGIDLGEVTYFPSYRFTPAPTGE